MYWCNCAKQSPACFLPTSCSKHSFIKCNNHVPPTIACIFSVKMVSYLIDIFQGNIFIRYFVGKYFVFVMSEDFFQICLNIFTHVMLCYVMCTVESMSGNKIFHNIEMNPFHPWKQTHLSIFYCFRGTNVIFYTCKIYFIGLFKYVYMLDY